MSPLMNPGNAGQPIAPANPNYNMEHPSLFAKSSHPFLWTTPTDRAEVMRNVEDPIWHRFLDETEAHFRSQGGLRDTKFPIFCHDGDLDEVMAAAALAYVRNDSKLWHWVGDWLRGLLAYYREILPEWRENQYRVMRGEKTTLGDLAPNPRQHFQGFTKSITYWVEAGLSSVVLHLLDLLEAYAPEELSAEEKAGVLDAVSDYANRYAFHEEAVKYNNRGMWANSGVLLSAIAQANPKAAALLRFQTARRNDEFCSTFLDDGFHIEGAPDYHLMAADALLAYLLPASHLQPEQDFFGGKDSDEFFQRYPSFADIVRAYFHTVIPGPVLWNQPRGCSVSTPVTVRPALVYAWKLTRDPEIGWFLKQRMGAVAPGHDSPLKVTRTALLGLGHYQPLINFWLYREVDNAHPPFQKTHVLPHLGSICSRSSWGPQASCVTIRFGYEGTGKGHRDHAHVSTTAQGVQILKDPFPRFGPAGLESSIFHNTVTLDNHEPTAVVGRLQSDAAVEGAEAFLISNSGGELPDRIFLHDPREETNYWFTNQPRPADFQFQRAVVHVHEQGLVIVDRLVAEEPRRIDWFFHSDLKPKGYDLDAEGRTSEYQLRKRIAVVAPFTLEVSTRGPVIRGSVGEWGGMEFQNDALSARFRFLALDAPLEIETGHYHHRETHAIGDFAAHGEDDYFIRARTEARIAHAVWLVEWGKSALDVGVADEDGSPVLRIGTPSGALECIIQFKNSTLTLNKS